MRLICPNCGAQYEVPVDVIPAGGRDVQCSDCGHTWFQLHPDDQPATQLPQDSFEAPAGEAPQSPEDRADAPLEDHPDEEYDEDHGDDPGDDAQQIDHAGINEFAAELRAALAARDGHGTDTAPPRRAPSEAPAPPRRAARSLDPSVAEVLRQEAAREARRRTDADPLESQPELGLQPPEDDEARLARDARLHMARIRGKAPLDEAPSGETPQAQARAEPAAAEPAHDPFAQEPEHPALSSSRRELLPDVEEVNQTLRVSSSARRMESAQGRALDAEEVQQQGSNFARGFGLMLILAVLAVLAYALAPALGGAVPALAPILESYVAAVDGLRLWLDSQLTALIG